MTWITLTKRSNRFAGKHHYGRIPAATFSFLLVFGVWAGDCAAVTYESPEVRTVIEKGLTFLEANTDVRLGGKCLIGLSFLKNKRGNSHPRVTEAVTACHQQVIDPNLDNYSLGIALIFLCELDPYQQRTQIQRYLDELLRRQKGNGGWGYSAGAYEPTGDTSQTQYAVLGIWMADRHGFEVPIQSIEKVANWLIRTQDPTGGWGYQGVDPASYSRVNQSPPTLSLSAAAMGSLMIVGDLVEFGAIQRPSEGQPAPPKLPSALVAVDEEKKTKARPRRRASIDQGRFNLAIDDGNRWFDRSFKVPAGTWDHYYLYGYERYRSYRELVENKVDAEPEWYQVGFDYLKSTQAADGSWLGSGGGPVDTAFGVLFLSRSAQKAIGATVRDYGEGVLRGGLGLPTSTTDIRETNGALLETPLAGSVDELLALMENTDNPELASLAESSQPVRLDNDIIKRTGQIERLRGLVRAESPEARLLAVRSLGQGRDLANVPVLLYALTDPDLRVVLEADKTLRFISRKLDGVGLEAGATDAEVKQAQAAWTQWLLSIRPDAQLLE